MVDSLSVMLALRGVLLTATLLPDAQAFENVRFTPVQGQPYIEENYVPATVVLKGLTRSGLVESRGLYIVKWYGVSGLGSQDIAAGVDEILSLFPPGSSITATSGDIVRIRGDVAPSRGQLRQLQPGWACVPVTIPFRILTLNPA